MLLVELTYNFECDWFVELSDNKLSDNKLSDNNLASELVGNRSFFKPITIEEIVIFMLIAVIPLLRGNSDYLNQPNLRNFSTYIRRKVYYMKLTLYIYIYNK